MADADYIIVGSGINGLVAAAMLGKKKNRVLVLEREAVEDNQAVVVHVDAI